MCLTPKIDLPTDRLGHAIVDFGDVGLNHANDVCDYISHEELHTIKSTTNDLIILQLNIRGLISKLSSLSALINSCSSENKVDVILLCETLLTT